jgi:DNA polymerase/3'-5' exonuclease PolX
MTGKAVLNHNGHLTQELERLEQMYAATGDTWRTYAYRKAVGILKRYPTPIRTEQDVRKINRRGLGPKMQKKLVEILSTGTLRKRAAMENDERIKVIELFTGIHGVGASTAQKWYNRGLRTLEELPLHVELSHTQQIGLRMYSDIQQRIPRDEVSAIRDHVAKAVQRLWPGCRVSILLSRLG